VSLSKYVVSLAISLPTYLAISLPTIANAAFPVGQWEAKFYVAGNGAASSSWSSFPPNGSLYSTHGICISSTGQWYGTSFAWQGYWFMSGLDVHLHGNTAPPLTWMESMELTYINPTLMTGYLQEWKVTPPPIDNRYATTAWTFKSATCLPPA
jgi:hypothetical protein